MAILAGQAEAVEILLEFGAEVNSVSGSQNITPLMTACSVGSEFVTTLIERGADPGMRDTRGMCARKPRKARQILNQVGWLPLHYLLLYLISKMKTDISKQANSDVTPAVGMFLF